MHGDNVACILEAPGRVCKRLYFVIGQKETNYKVFSSLINIEDEPRELEALYCA